MQGNFPILLAVPGNDRQKAAACDLPLVHMTYTLGSTRLYRTQPPAGRGGIMAVDCSGNYTGTPATLVADATRECMARGFTGIFLDREQPADSALAAACTALERACSAKGIRLYVSPALAKHTHTATVLVSTAIYSGTLERHMTQAAERYGHGRIAMDIERICTDFTLPAPSGQGKAMTATAFQALVQKLHPNVFFSGELCANYFTYRTDGRTHFVLFDDLRSIQRKLALGERLGVQCAFLFYPEVETFLPQLLAR